MSNMVKSNNITKDVHKDNSNPKYIGPGTWNVIHTLAINAKTKKEQLIFITQMKIICEQFPCDKCSNHCKEYIKNHPMEEYVGTTLLPNSSESDTQLGMFIWSWKFHNAVNYRIGKNIMSWDVAHNLYARSPHQKNVCSKDCSDTDKNIQPHKELVIPKRKPEKILGREVHRHEVHPHDIHRHEVHRHEVHRHDSLEPDVKKIKGYYKNEIKK